VVRGIWLTKNDTRALDPRLLPYGRVMRLSDPRRASARPDVNLDGPEKATLAADMPVESTTRARRSSGWAGVDRFGFVIA
jgi:hypothetical protein